MSERGQPWRVALLVDRERNADLLESFFESEPNYQVGSEERDLVVADAPALRREREAVAARKEADHPVYLPVLLVVASRNGDGAAGEALDRIGDAADLVDEVVETPTSRATLRRRVETVLRARELAMEVGERERQYRTLVESLPEAVLLVRDGEITYANDRATDLLADNGTLGGRFLSDLVAPGDREAVEAVVERTVAEGRAGEFVEATFRAGDSERLPCEVTGVEVTFEGGTAVQLVVRDLSEQRRRERRLRLFGRAMEEAHHGITIAEAEDDQPMVYANEAFEDITGYSVAESLGRNCRFLQGAETDPEARARLRAAVEEERPTTVEIRNYRKDGTPFWNRVDVAPIRDEAGETTHFLGLQEDVTERREREADLERYETIVETAGDPIYALDAAGRFETVNDALVEGFGYPREALVGEPATNLVDEQTASRFEGVIRDLWNGERDTRTVEVTLKDADGNRHRCEVTVALLPTGEDGAFRGTVGVIRDVTATHRRKQAIAMSDRVLRHNFRNNLNVVRGQAKELEKDADSEVAERAAAIHDEADRLLSLGENARYLYEVLRTEPTDISTVDLVPAVERAVTAVGERFPDARIERALPEQAPVQAHHVIEQAVVELVENAVVYAAGETPTVRVSVTTGDGVELRVSDEGEGFADGELAALESGVESPLMHTSGLGLWLVYWTVEVSNGEFRVENEDDRTVVVVRLDPAD